MSDSAGAAIERVLNGDAAAVDDLAKFTQHQLIEASLRMPMILGSGAVRRVIESYVSRRCDMARTQAWAAFVRHGHIVPAKGPLTPLNIEYDRDHEDAIAEAVARLDELGDIIDGEFRPGEADQLLAALR